MSRIIPLTLAAFLLALPGCSDDTEPTPDKGTVQKDGGADGPITNKDGGGDGQVTNKDGLAGDKKITGDKKVTGDQTATDQKVAADALVPPAKDLKPFTLQSSFKVNYRFNDPMAGGSKKGAYTFNIAGSDVYLLDAGGSPFKIAIQVGTLDVKTGKPGTLSPVFSATPTLPTGESGYAGGYLALSPKKFAAVGYTSSKTFTGEVIWGNKGIKTPKKVAKAKGNYDVIFLDDKTMLVNGTGLGAAQSGQGVYLYEEGKTPRLLIKDMGTASGVMALGKTTVFAGGFFGKTFKNNLYGFSLAEVKTAISGGKTLSASTDGDLIYTGPVLDAATVEDDLAIITVDSSWKFKAVDLIDNTVAGNTVTKNRTITLVSGGSGSEVSKLAGNGTKKLGLYIKGKTSSEIAIIELYKALPAAKTISPFTLNNNFTVSQRITDPITAGASAFNIAGSDVYVFEGGGATFAAKVSVGSINATTGKLGTLATVFNATPTLPTGETAFAGGYLALSPKKLAAVGYTTSKTFTGEVIWGDKGIKTPKLVAKAKGNYDVIFLDDKTMLINATGVGATVSGQGVYVYKEGSTPNLLVKDLGTASGFMALGKSTVFAGGYDSKTFKSFIYGFTQAELKYAINNSKTLSATTAGDKVHDGSAADAAAVEDDLVVITLDSSWKYKGVTRYPVTVMSGDKLSVGTGGSVVTGGSPTTITKLAGDGTKDLGLYLKGSSKMEIAIITKK